MCDSSYFYELVPLASSNSKLTYETMNNFMHLVGLLEWGMAHHKCFCPHRASSTTQKNAGVGLLTCLGWDSNPRSEFSSTSLKLPYSQSIRSRPSRLKTSRSFPNAPYTQKGSFLPHPSISIRSPKWLLSEQHTNILQTLLVSHHSCISCDGIRSNTILCYLVAYTTLFVKTKPGYLKRKLHISYLPYY